MKLHTDKRHECIWNKNKCCLPRVSFFIFKTASLCISPWTFSNSGTHSSRETLTCVITDLHWPQLLVNQLEPNLQLTPVWSRKPHSSLQIPPTQKSLNKDIKKPSSPRPHLNIPAFVHTCGQVITPCLQVYKLPDLVWESDPFASISGAGELTRELLCSNKPVLLLFQFGLIWLSAWVEKPLSGYGKPINY